MDPTAAIDPAPPRVLAIGRVVAEFSAGPALDSDRADRVLSRIDEAIDGRHRLLWLTAGGLRLSAASVAAFNCYLRSVVVCDGVRMPFDRVDTAHGGTAYSWFNFLRYLGARFDS